MQPVNKSCGWDALWKHSLPSDEAPAPRKLLATAVPIVRGLRIIRATPPAVRGNRRAEPNLKRVLWFQVKNFSVDPSRPPSEREFSMTESTSRTWAATWFAITTLVSAFLVFQVQPVISKAVLPWFGGSPAVWTTSMLFFQILLFLGYAYAHLLTRFLSPRVQGSVHFLLLAIALCLLPITPTEAWKPQGEAAPTQQLIVILLVHVGLPYFLLSSTGPLVQAWFSQQLPGMSPYRLYALSNFGSLAALISYPFLVEPQLTSRAQGATWSVGFCIFALASAYLASRLAGPRVVAEAGTAKTTGAAPTWSSRLLWVCLPALASVTLLAATNHLCQDIAVVPFMWIAPLSIYLLTFIVCFDRESWYSRRTCGLMAAASAIGLTLIIEKGLFIRLGIEVAGYLSLLFWTCMACHGELVRSKPDPKYLTTFYLLSSAGGALGGVFVAILCPALFTTHWEINLCILAAATLGNVIFFADALGSWLASARSRWFLAGGTSLLAIGYVASVQLQDTQDTSVTSVRNFYGVLHVGPTPDGQARVMIHGRTTHGHQFVDARKQDVPTTYYSPNSAVGLTLTHLHRGQPLRVGAVGLGVGTLAAYGRPGDYYRFYEINPAVEVLARERFTYLERSSAATEVILGDARLSLDREAPQNFDVLVLDAFSSDSIPTHLMTREAFDVYRRHVRPNGVIAIHISNRNLELDPVVTRLAEYCGLECRRVISPKRKATGALGAKWMLLTSNREFLDSPQIAAVARHPDKPTAADPLWTDQYNNLFQILTVY